VFLDLAPEGERNRWCDITMVQNDRCQYFNQYRSYANVILDHHKIEKAIRYAAGPRDFDKRIKKIWGRVLSKRTTYPKNIYNKSY